LGLAIVALGGGRTVAGAAIDPAVGLTELAGIGKEVGPNRPLCRIHAGNEADADAASVVVRQAYMIGEKAPALRPPVIGRIAAAQQ
jgi:thymidine phosphorylase